MVNENILLVCQFLHIDTTVWGKSKLRRKVKYSLTFDIAEDQLRLVAHLESCKLGFFYGVFDSYFFDVLSLAGLVASAAAVLVLVSVPLYDQAPILSTRSRAWNRYSHSKFNSLLTFQFTSSIKYVHEHVFELEVVSHLHSTSPPTNAFAVLWLSVVWWYAFSSPARHWRGKRRYLVWISPILTILVWIYFHLPLGLGGVKVRWTHTALVERH